MSEFTRKDLRETVESVGGEGIVSARLDVTKHSIRHAYDSRRFPASWYGPMVTLALEAGVEAPPVEMFHMREMLAAQEVGSHQ